MLRHILRAGLPARGVAASRGAQLTSLAKHGARLAATRMASPGKVVAATMLAAAPILIAAEPAPSEDEIDVAMRECLAGEDVAEEEEDGEEFDDDAALEETLESVNVAGLKPGAAKHNFLGDGTIIAINDTQQLLEGHTTKFDNLLNAGKVLFRWKSKTNKGAALKTRWHDGCSRMRARTGSFTMMIRLLGTPRARPRHRPGHLPQATP